MRASPTIKIRVQAARYLASHPGQVRYVPRWVRQRSLTPLAMRAPWWSYDAADWLRGHLPRGARVFEYGGGGSTLYLEDLGAAVTVVEHDMAWCRQLAQAVGPGTDLLSQGIDAAGSVGSAASEGYFDSYVAAIDPQPDASLDLVIVDGRARVACVQRAISKVKAGGLLLLDDSDRVRYQPAVALLASWERHVFTGLKPGYPVPAQTSIWRRPG
jgi:hypothetical protein